MAEVVAAATEQPAPTAVVSLLRGHEPFKDESRKMLLVGTNQFYCQHIQVPLRRAWNERMVHEAPAQHLVDLRTPRLRHPPKRQRED